jgi:hypothetical protein
LQALYSQLIQYQHSLKQDLFCAKAAWALLKKIAKNPLPLFANVCKTPIQKLFQTPDMKKLECNMS